MSRGTLFDKVWDAHVVEELADGTTVLHVDRHLMHELTSVDAVAALERRKLPLRDPKLTFANLDHVISSAPGRRAGDEAWSTEAVETFRAQSTRLGIDLFDVDDGRQGIVHVTAPEQGLSLPGTTVACADSHTCTHGAFGAIGMGMGSSEQVQVMASQTLRQRKPGVMRITLIGKPAPGTTAKDVILHVIGQLGVTGGNGHALEYAGAVIDGFDMEARMTLCNLSIELGARVGMIAPDEVTFEYLHNRPYTPRGKDFAAAVDYWRTLRSDADAVFDREAVVDIEGIGPQITWGTTPEQVIRIDGTVPDPAAEPDPQRRATAQAALDYMRLRPLQVLAGTRIDRVFIGSCTNSRISDLRAAAAVARTGRVAPHVRAWVVPGSLLVREQAQREGLHRIFLDAGFEWREPGCSMCVGANGDLGAPGERCVSTSNRNFVGRQGPGVMTHLASPATAAASALAGAIRRSV
ncbi:MULTISPECIES: 3-isopropylmalate dehydratase large subunit [unclassified Achromobacter]|uniref:3-isopropylmalate dehydratase large subunit n=1 Tax=unclassified Achromobacter TaxID=2626865 RepID=UPI000B51A58F|nr:MULTISPECIES: 3-isopropylmalate dehydratase large subunit [unclassified Achromobacter]OWT80736.1 3-isopropylmalate dehydratase large subunit [Achromobacter sp. HZ34]OWT81252.1 3-isopropylmalate dehydratase large subunit [Achromobacter sp. HZ28]